MFGHRYYGARHYGPRYFGDGGDLPPVVVVTSTPAGVHRVPRARFLRRAPKLPWEEEEQRDTDVVVQRVKRRRIPLPEVRALQRATDGDVPIQTIREISAPSITIPELGTARLVEAIEDDDDLMLWLI